MNRFLKNALDTPWAILPLKLAQIRTFLFAHLSGETITAEKEAEFLAAAESRQKARQQGSVAVIPVYGTIAQRMNLMSAMSGGASTEILQKEIRAAVADPSISAVVLNIDSPGGSVTGVTELASAIREMRAQKPIVAVANSMAASAAYWIAASASEIVVTPSGEVGSIGVFTMHVDESAALESDGLKVSLISAGPYKTEGNSFEPLTEEARAAIQENVDTYYQMFVRDVAIGRGVSVGDVKATYGGGRMLPAKEAKAAGLADRIETLDETIARLSRSASSRNRLMAERELQKMFALKNDLTDCDLVE